MAISPLSLRRKFLLFLVLQLPTSLFADVIVLKNGERLEGKITTTTETTVEAEIQMSASITDVRTFQKTEIANIEKPDPSEEAFEAAKKVGPGLNSSTPAGYDQAIGGTLQPFLLRYSSSVHAPAVKEMMAALQEEKRRVAAGDLKLENEWFSPTDIEKQKVQVSAMLLFQKIKALGQSGDTIGALNQFTVLEKNYPGSKAYPLAVDYAVQLIARVQQEITAKTATLQSDLAEREKGMSVLPDYRKAPLIAAAAAEDAKVNATLDAAQKSGQKWTSIYSRNKRSIDDLQKTTTAEGTRLAAIKTPPMHASIASVATANAALTEGNVSAAKAELQKATTLWSANLQLKDLAAALVLAEATPTPSPSVSPSASPILSPTPGPKPKSAPAAPAVSPKSASTSAEPPRAFLKTVPGALTVFGASAVIAGGISYFNKTKSKKSAFETV